MRLRFDADAGELSFFKCNSPLPPEWEGAAWAPVGEPLGGLKGRLLCMACTIYHDKDKIEWRVGAKPPPAMPQGPDLFAAKPTAPRGVFPAISDWRYAQASTSFPVHARSFSAKSLGDLMGVPPEVCADRA